MIKKRTARKKLKNAFSIAGIYYQTKWNGKIIRNYPHILDVRIYDNKNVFVFRLPPGIDPAELKKKLFVFKSIFGELVELKMDRVVVMTVYTKTHNGSYPFNFEEWEPLMKKYRLPILAGKDINGEIYCYDMTTNPHLLIAGETGSGKSVMLRAILTSLIKAKRTGLKLHLADLKRSEFHLFRNVDIVDSVMTKKHEVAKCVNWFHQQLDVRGDILDQLELSHVDELPPERRVDYLVLCIDEFSVLRKEKETMEQLADLTALGRALGIYVILSTQRPDSKVVEGLMKANLTVRYAFRHADKVNSRITLGDGAKEDASTIPEEDRGKFFMRYSGLKYLQAPLLEVSEAKELLKTYKSPFIPRAREDDIIDVEATEVVEFEMLGEGIHE